jgi:hypothetical protein
MYQLAPLCTKNAADLKNLKSEKRTHGVLIIPQHRPLLALFKFFAPFRAHRAVPVLPRCRVVPDALVRDLS